MFERIVGALLIAAVVLLLVLRERRTEGDHADKPPLFPDDDAGS
jgi:hypothetical protein